MTARTRDVTFQLCGAGLALLISLGGIVIGQALLGPLGRYALMVSVPAGVILGYSVIRLLQFAHRVLADEG